VQEAIGLLRAMVDRHSGFNVAISYMSKLYAQCIEKGAIGEVICGFNTHDANI
jgi:hypothetical protein